MSFQFPGQVKNGIARCVKSDEQLIHHNDNFRMFRMLKRIDDLLVVFPFAAVLTNSRFPKPLHGQLVLFIQVLFTFPFIGTRNQHFA